jgi:hypothetical protein
MAEREGDRIWECPVCGERLDLCDRGAESPDDHLAFHELAERHPGRRPGADWS